jgi:hypothetical protein
MELNVLLDRLKMEHLLTQLDGICAQAAKGDLDYQGFLAQASKRNGAGGSSGALRAGCDWPGSRGSRPGSVRL